MIYVTNNISRGDAVLGVVRAEGVQVDRIPASFEEQLDTLITARKKPLIEAEEAIRKAARDLLRNGQYKPTGRGKPASEYLVRAAQQEDASFPRVNAPVDVANYVSLQSLLPISLWDLDRAATDRFRFRLGQPGEAYVFNTADQTIKLDDLIVGCGLDDPGDDGTPMVNPVKDSLATKTTDETHRVAACVYTPGEAVSTEELAAICASFAALLGDCGDEVETAYGIVLPGETGHI